MTTVDDVNHSIFPHNPITNNNHTQLCIRLNQRSMFILFFPIVIFGLLSLYLDNFMELSEFKEVFTYFKFIYELRLYLFVASIIALQVIHFCSGKIIMYICFLYNLILVFMDLCNCFKFIENYKQFSNMSYYKTIYLKIGINYVFIGEWLTILVSNFVKDR